LRGFDNGVGFGFDNGVVLVVLEAVPVVLAVPVSLSEYL
jgi:hypothetical protein